MGPVLVGNPIRLASEVESGDACLMRGVCSLIWLALVGLFHSRLSLEAEILALRHQLNVLRRISPKKPTFTIIDRLVFAGLYRLAPGILDALVIVTPETVIRWHRAGFRLFWRWKSRCRVGRPKVPFEIRQLIRDMSLDAHVLRFAASRRSTPCSFRKFSDVAGSNDKACD